MKEKNESEAAVNAKYAGTLKSKEADDAKALKMTKKQWNDGGWKKYAYPNRSMRRAYMPKGRLKYRMTELDLKKPKKSYMQKLGEVLRSEIEHGQMLHESFMNEIATDQMHFEQAKNVACQKSLIEAKGNVEGMKAYNSNRRLQGIYDDKKIMQSNGR